MMMTMRVLCVEVYKMRMGMGLAHIEHIRASIFISLAYCCTLLLFWH